MEREFFYKYHICIIHLIPPFSLLYETKLKTISPKKILILHLQLIPTLQSLPYLTHIIFGTRLDNPPKLSSDTIPHNVTHLTFNCEFTQLYPLFPPKLTHLVVSNHSSLDKDIAYLPSTLQEFRVLSAPSFNRPVDHLPISLTSLTLPLFFNQFVDHLPPALKHISFATSFNRSILGILASRRGF